MKKFIILCSVLITIILILDICYYRFDIYIDFQPNKEITTFSKTKGKDIYVKNAENKFEKFEIKGVDLGTGIPGHSATDYAINEETYLRWFKQIQELGANTIRVYTILQDDFYNAVYEYNENNPKPLYIIQGLDVDDYAQFSSVDAYSEEFFGQMIEDSKIVSDVIHGKRKILTKKKYGNGNYQKDISKWVIGYILGADWEDTTVAYTDETKIRKSSYKGKYMYTTEEATPFEAMLANAGDKLYEYETNRYKDQRLIAFSNWPQTDPFSYSQDITEHFRKVIKVDTEHIKTTENVISGIFASYHIYPYFPDYLSYVPEVSTFVDETGKVNTYREYLKRINNHHSIPVIVSEFGVPSSRGMAGRDKHTGRNQGGMSEKEQGEAVVRCYKDIKSAGCAGGIVFLGKMSGLKEVGIQCNQ